MISGKFFFFLCLVVFWKIVWKIFYSVWSNVKMKRKKKKTETQCCNPTTAIHHKSTANHRRKTHKTTITAKPTQSKSRTNQNKQIKTHKSSRATPVLGARARRRERWWHEHEHTGSWRSRARAQAHRFSSGPDLGWLRSWGRFNRGAASIVDRQDQIWGGFDRWSSVQIWGGFDRGAASITGRLRSGEGSRSGSGRQSEWELRKRVERERAEKEQRGESRTLVLGKWFTENFRFFLHHFTVKYKHFQFDFCFPLQQTPANAENVLRKTFSAETNGALVEVMCLRHKFMNDDIRNGWCCHDEGCYWSLKMLIHNL